MRRKVFAVAAAAFFLMNVQLYAATASATNAPIGNQFNYGELTVQGPIRGDLDRTIEFEIIPGEDFTADITLWNTDAEQNSADVLLRLDMPNGARVNLMEENVTLEGLQSITYPYSEYVPDNLQLYGRYTLKLFINNVLADFCQFDLNSRTNIEVRWDDGVLVNAYAWYDAGNKWAIRGCMPDRAVVDEIGVHVLSEADPYWPWPDAVHQDIGVQLYDNTGGGGYPGTLLSDNVANGGASGDAVASVSVTITSSAFFVANNQLDPYPSCEGQGVDAALNHWDQMWAEVSGAWQPYYSISGDLMIWANGHVGSQSITIGTPPAQQ